MPSCTRQEMQNGGRMVILQLLQTLDIVHHKAFISLGINYMRYVA